MKRIVAFALAALVSGTSLGQMMGGRLSTSTYFPMVDGARYEYIHTGGPWATSTMVVRGGQTWAGQGGLYAMHTTYTCNVGVACATDATDFFGMGPGGVYHYGGIGADPAGMQYSMMTFTSPEWILKDPVYPGSMMTGGGYSNAESWTATVRGSGSLMGAQNHMSTYFAQGLGTLATPAGTFANVLHVREQRGSGAMREVWYAPGVGMVMMDDGSRVTKLAGYTMPGAVGQPAGGAAALPFTPFNGLWWNPDESGTGYNIQVQRGMAVATIFSYTPAGDPVWYYAAGPLTRTADGVAMSSMLDRYRGGQCVTCVYAPPTAAGNDGPFSIQFSSSTSATVRLPGGRMSRIQPQAW